MYRKIALVFLIFLLLAGRAGADSESASLAIEEANRTMSEMLEMGFGITYANDTLNEARILFSQGHYLGAESLAKEVLEIKEKAGKVKEMIDQVESRIYEVRSKGYDVSEASELFDSGLAEFGIDNYAGAEELMNEALNVLDNIEAEGSIRRVGGGVDPLRMFLDNLWIAIIAVLLFLVVTMRAKGLMDRKKMGKRMESLRTEERRLEDLIKDVQKKYFQSKEISKLDYEITTKRYQGRLSGIKKEIKMLEGELPG